MNPVSPIYVRCTSQKLWNLRLHGPRNLSFKSCPVSDLCPTLASGIVHILLNSFSRYPDNSPVDVRYKHLSLIKVVRHSRAFRPHSDSSGNQLRATQVAAMMMRVLIGEGYEFDSRRWRDSAL
jgi:hypothetical protein